MTVGSPVSPVAAPELTLSKTSEDMSIFSVNLTHSAPTNDQGHTPSAPVGIVFHIRDTETNVNRYYAQVCTGQKEWAFQTTSN